ncbi:secreted RxLR effector protein 161-like [Cornus florida]|uniref:secreted RxLR effector protein 161-like n=1 Tax=Cornus florida TaxID=4283 RepID=UPI00289C8880|nr:secreted RxLR effector protein 161-like [Cornus florida]
MDDCKAVSTPLCPNTKLLLEYTTEAVPLTLYRLIIGSFLYLTASRPNIMYLVGLVARFQSNPKVSHLQAAFSDADWGGSLPDRKSTSGYCYTLGSNVVLWLSKKQDTVSLSTSEAEYIVASQADEADVKVADEGAELSSDLVFQAAVVDFEG